MSAPRDMMSYVDPDTGFTMLPGTQRPDGTWRKPRRVKEGYTPQDEVPLYESKGKAIAKARDTGYIPGLGPPAASGFSDISNFKIDTFVIPTPVHTIPGLNTDPSAPVVPPSSKSKKKKKSGNQASASQSNTENGVASIEAKMSKACIAEKAPDRNSAGQPVATDPAKKLRNLKKKLRDIETLEAKLDSGEITSPEPEQLEKVARKNEVMTEIAALELVQS
jgi:partner of Y14 and mago protein